MANWTADHDIYVDAGGNVVPEDSPDAAYLLVAEGGTLSAEQAQALGVELEASGAPKGKLPAKAVERAPENKAQEPPAAAARPRS
jgi:hypothetical protein